MLGSGGVLRRWLSHAFAPALAMVLTGALPATAIVGAATDRADSSSVVMILNRQGQRAGFCSGVVLAPDVVLTAAHCVPKGGDLRVHYPNAGADPVLMPVAAAVIHPGYHERAIERRERSIDLALIRLQQPLPSQFQPARISDRGTATIGSRFKILGYGVTRETVAASSGTLHMAVLATRTPLSDVLLWSGDAEHRGTGACTGDSGGPVMAEGSSEVSAIMLWSAGTAGRSCGDLTQSLWLAPHRSWIERILKEWQREIAQPGQ